MLLPYGGKEDRDWSQFRIINRLTVAQEVEICHWQAVGTRDVRIEQCSACFEGNAELVVARTVDALPWQLSWLWSCESGGWPLEELVAKGTGTGRFLKTPVVREDGELLLAADFRRLPGDILRWPGCPWLYPLVALGRSFPSPSQLPYPAAPPTECWDYPPPSSRHPHEITCYPPTNPPAHQRPPDGTPEFTSNGVQLSFYVPADLK